MTSKTHHVRLALGASAVLAAALVTGACGSDTAVDPEPAFVGGAPSAVTGGSHQSPGSCSATADQAQRRIDAGQQPCGHGPLGYVSAPEGHHPQ